MFPGITAAAIVSEATSFVSLIEDQVLLVVGLALMFSVAAWVVRKLSNR